MAADQYPADRRATIIGWIVWAATIGAIGGPALLAPSRGLAESLGLNGLVGPYLVNVFSLVLATAAMLWAPPTMDAPARDMGASTTAADVRLGDVLAHAGVRLALAAMVSGQFVMVLLMTMTPLHVRHEGLGLGAIGLVISAHTLGMYAISPVTGRLGDLYGRVPLIVAGIITLVASGVVGIVATRGSYALLVLALLLLGVGWNLGFVGGSALLTESVTPQERVRLQGFGDSLVWGGGAIASLGSGWMLEHAGFAVLNAIGIVLSLAPLLPLMTYQRRVRAQPLEIESI
ncbi:MAG: MFS transporter [Vicinamibacterales bacterium]